MYLKKLFLCSFLQTIQIYFLNGKIILIKLVENNFSQNCFKLCNWLHMNKINFEFCPKTSLYGCSIEQKHKTLITSPLVLTVVPN